jgi:hypothetical protein
LASTSEQPKTGRDDRLKFSVHTADVEEWG